MCWHRNEVRLVSLVYIAVVPLPAAAMGRMNRLVKTGLPAENCPDVVRAEKNAGYCFQQGIVEDMRIVKVGPASVALVVLVH